MEIAIKDWETTVPNKVYTMRGENISSVLVLSRQTIPTIKDVFEYLREKCEVQASKPHIVLPGGNGERPAETLDEFIAKFPPRVLQDISQRKDSIVHFFDQAISLPGLISNDEPKERQQYVQAVFGLLPNDYLTGENLAKLQANPEVINGVLLHDSVREAGLGLQVMASFQIINGRLIPAEDAKTLIKYQTAKSAGLIVTPADYNPEQVSEIADVVYSALVSGEAIAAVNDTSLGNIEGYTLAAMGALANVLNAQSQAASHGQSLKPGRLLQ